MTKKLKWLSIPIAALLITVLLVTMLSVGSSINNDEKSIAVGTTGNGAVINLLWTIGKDSSVTMVYYNSKESRELPEAAYIIISKAWSEAR